MIREKIRNIYLHRGVLWDMAISQLKVKYSGSILGMWLAIINPLLLMLAISFVFTIIFKVEMKRFYLFTLSGIYPWMFFSSALSEAPFCILGQKNIMQQFNIPIELIPLSSVLANFFNFLIGWLVMYPLFIFFKPKIITLFPFLVIVLAASFLFIYGLALILSTINVFLRDIGQLLGTVMMFWFWVTPVFYSIDMVPAKFRWICGLNPMTPYVLYYRKILYQGAIPDLFTCTGIFILAILSVFIGFIIFSRLEPKLLKRI